MKFDDFNLSKCADGLLPVIIQDAVSLKVLMLGYMNREAFDLTRSTGMVTFYSRTRNCLWTKGETSGNYLHVVSMYADCDGDTLLIMGDEQTGIIVTKPDVIETAAAQIFEQMERQK